MGLKNTLYHKCMHMIDSFLNKITMYRLTLYYLIGLLVAAVILSFFHFLSFNPLDIVINSLLAVIVCWSTNLLIAKLLRAVINAESAIITGLILALIIPISFPQNAAFFIVASAVAILSKYFVTIEKRHIFNPAAVSVLAIALLSPSHQAIWWIGTPEMLPYVVIGGFLLMKKMQRETMIITLSLVYFLCITTAGVFHGRSGSTLLTLWNVSVSHSAFFFFAFVMFTEPLTTPPTKKLQNYYAALVAFLYATPQLRLFSFAITPEMALCIGNIYSYIVSPKYRLELVFDSKETIDKNIAVFTFGGVKTFNFIPGQYMEWTLPHEHMDDRGNRRYFSIASSPNEKNVLLLIKFYNPSSSFKKALLALDKGETIIANALAGDFVLPKDLQKPLVFMAGGIGVAPFRSMIKHIVETKLQANIMLLYSNKTADEIVFSDIFSQAQKFGIKTVYTLTDREAIPENWEGEKGRISEEMITKHIPDFLERTFYLSGPSLMIDSYKQLLKTLHVSSKNIKTDYFPGY